MSVRCPHPRGESGASLIVALLFLLVLTVLGLAVMRATTIEVRIVGFEQDRNLAFEAAEAALRDAERDLTLNGIDTDAPWEPDCSGGGGGLCRPANTATPLWESIAWTDANSRRYGTRTGIGAYPVNVSAVPRYMIEILPDLPPPIGSSMIPGARASTTGGTAYRITAVGWGRNDETRTMLQSVFIKE
jgi:type IV pilus assembly protein PilX